ncbi:LysR substrate-binding domain-containing protein [Cognatiyoonia sp. IB215446]|uniref:LysR substrate-binding domain-containing protein n=1 Tax=Cognatiyoonia sp. IB215446 TaxID=3097355 RepID=UPI002A133F15|nr:LysR substrate-binding domain-containing protein [Cognatiyoonia sp. IB215446]MDX8349398.1 LysR substrate-binding domain-containing protein [Cognatiyoonia sp. IB215446]
MSVSLKAMRYFNLAVARGSIAEAADELNIAASAVSAAIGQVEDAFGLTLITRQRSRGITANANGRLIAQKFARLLEEYQSILADGAELKGSLSGALRVGYYAPVAPAFLPRIFSQFLPADSDAVLHLQECNNDTAQDGLLKGDFDVILFVAEGAQAAIDFDVLIKAPPYCLLHASHRLAERTSVSLAEIAQERLVVLDRPVVAAYYQRLFESFAPDITIAAFANSTEMVRSLVGAGHGCAVLNMQPLTAISYGGEGLIAVPISDPLPPLTLAIAYDRTRPRRIVQHFVDSCRAQFAEDGPHQCVVPGQSATA